MHVVALENLPSTSHGGQPFSTLDVRSAYAEVCRADPKSKWCQPAR